MESHQHHTEPPSSSNADGVLLMNASLGKIIITAVCLGVVHILTGPDHLGALAALSSGRSWRAAFALGLQWGCGHSVGILSVAAICLGIGHALNLGGGFRAFCNYATGAFLVAIGLWTLYGAKADFEVQTKPVSKWNYVECHDKTYYQTQLSPKSKKTSRLCGSFWPQGSQQQQQEEEADSKTSQKKARQSATAVSVCVGLFHGVAGPGGVLGILPVLAMQHDGSDGAVLLHAIVYLTCFCLSSMLCMGIFAALYGELTHRVATNARRQPSATKIQIYDSDSEDKKHAAALITFRVVMLSSLLSILVGIAWLVLQACGVLDHVFGHNHHGE